TELPRMLKSYQPQNGGFRGAVIDADGEIPPESVWLDLFDPSAEEREKDNRLLVTELPTRAVMQDTPISTPPDAEEGPPSITLRLWTGGGLRMMTACALSLCETAYPAGGAVSFVFSNEKVVAIPFLAPQSVRPFEGRCQPGTVLGPWPDAILLGFIDVIVGRL